MNLTSEDLAQIRSVIEDVVFPLRGEIEALRNDIKDIYDMLQTCKKVALPTRLSESFSRREAAKTECRTPSGREIGRSRTATVAGTLFSISDSLLY